MKKSSAFAEVGAGAIPRSRSRRLRNIDFALRAIQERMLLFSDRVDRMLSDWLKSKDVDEFADALVADLQSRFPPVAGSAVAKNASKKLHKTHRAVFSRIEAFARSADLSVYRKARLGNRVKWALTDAGYAKPFVDAFVHELVTLLALAPRVVEARRRIEKNGK